MPTMGYSDLMLLENETKRQLLDHTRLRPPRVAWELQLAWTNGEEGVNDPRFLSLHKPTKEAQGAMPVTLVVLEKEVREVVDTLRT